MEDQHRLEMKDLMHEITLENEEQKESRRKVTNNHTATNFVSTLTLNTRYPVTVTIY